MLLLWILWTAQADIDRAVSLWRQGQPAAAEAALRAIVDATPANAAAWKWLGVVHASRSEHELAEQPFREACRLAPADSDACYFHGRNLYLLNRFEPALAVLEKRLPDDPQPWRIRLAMAQSLEALGRGAESEKQFRASIAAEPKPGRPEDDPRLHYGVFLLRQGRTEESLQALEQAPASSRSFSTQGRAMSQLGRLEEAVSRLEKAIALDSRDWNAHLLLGKVYQRLGRPADADRHLKLGEQGLKSP
ncbi:MAG: tetratricopeptide repeat protein [Bryobacteraceae bacterium]